MRAENEADAGTIELIASVVSQLGVVVQRRSAEEQLRDSDERFRRLSDASLDAVAISQAGRIVEVNQAFRTLFGYSDATAIGMDVLELVESSARTAVRSRSPDDEGTHEVRAVRASGSVFDAEMTSKSVVHQGRTMRVSVARDISVRKAVDRMKNDFVSLVSHELRTPLTSIMGSLKLIEGGVAGVMPPRAAELVRVARTNADRLIRLINDILDLEKMEAGRLDLHPVRLDAGELLRAAADGVAGMAANFRVRIETLAPLGIDLDADRDRMLQVLTNLLSNAIKHTAPDGVVTAIAERTASRTVRMSVADQGPGIPADQIPLLFTRFQQLEAPSTRRTGGTGLGLAISRSIVEQHGGTMGVDSEPGVWTEFWLELQGA